MATCILEREADLPVPPRERSAFNFENVTRNSRFETTSGFCAPKAMKTGTTICGVVFKGGVVLGADTRATEGTIVADKNCEKIHYIAPNIYCCGAGTSADTENVTSMVASTLALQRLTMGKQSRVLAAQTVLKRHLFRYQGHVSAALVLGGVDVNGPYLSTVAPHGSTDRLPYVTMGSGSLAAMAVFEAEYKDDLTEKEAIALVHKAISRGIFEDLGSGSNVDIRVVRKDGSEYLRGYDKPNERAFRKAKPYIYPPGSVVVLKETVKQLDSSAMQTD
uniref:Proteasome subunit beta n=1 Tax=Eutreptiella gymnastica TaxID=73025 RepID=A0A7S4CR87_9EUGL